VKGTKTLISKKEGRKRIKESRYNKEYESCMTEEIPEYLGKESAKERKMRREKIGTYSY
jgi:hypothetical protein